MPSDLPFLLSVAGLSGSLAGLAGLVGGLRRGEGLRPIDRFRLREIVEFAFATTLLALSTVPLTTILGSPESAIRVEAAAAVAYLLAIAIILFRRLRTSGIGLSMWIAVAGILDTLIILMAIATVSSGAVASLEVLLLLLLARPMTAFLFVLASFDQPDHRDGAPAV